MTDPEPLGTVVADGDTFTVHFERRLPFPIDEVWAALTEPDRLADWLAPTAIDLRLGGDVRVDFGDGGVCDGTITAVEPPTVLEYGWRFPDEHDSAVRWELEREGDATVLRLRHRLLRGDIAAGYGSGWHAHIDQLAGHLSGSTPEWFPRYQELLPAYKALAEIAHPPNSTQ